ncbi:trafficking protein particle complex subunit 8-like [Clavelina lepadiformis]|uniref:trafficking protein particle complex subunit 8-like n=1 Tax=Clavelina lepadiformis TaxID=159417 RepID=UPI004042DEE9
MSQCSQSTDGFIKTLFGPRVGVLCSQDAEIISRRNNLSFAELIRPFCTINSEIHVHDSNNQAYVIRDLHITTCDMRCSPADENAVKQLLSDVVSDAANILETSKTLSLSSDGYSVAVNMSCPWFEAYRDTLTATAPQKPHEFINHCPACMLVVSSRHPNPVEEFGKLSQHQNQIQHSTQHHSVRWMVPNTLKYYVLLHDNSHPDFERAKSVMNDLQSMYGNNNCYLLRINSKDASETQQLPDPWGCFLNRKLPEMATEANGINMSDIPSNDLSADPLSVSSTEVHPSDKKWMQDLKQKANISDKGYGCCLTLADHEGLKTFMHDFASRGLIPHIEKLIRNFSEQIASRKAIHRSIFRATRTFFGGGKTSSAPALKNYGSGGLESPELQVRKLADLYFLCQMYDQAYHYYHAVRKDFANEQVWIHAAGASEMAALANFMQPRSQRAYPAHYVDSAIDTYSTTTSDDYLALRCGLVSLECLRMQGLYAEASAQLFRLTSEVDDLRSAILLEQIAHCFLRTQKPQLRKFAFHIVLAGHRYGKVSQRSCALLCYRSALQVYRGSGWNLAEDHINFTIGRQSFNLKQLEVACESFSKLLNGSKQPTSQQAMFLHEYLQVAKRNTEATKAVTNLPVPLINHSSIAARNATSGGSVIPDSKWKLLEESVQTVVTKESPQNSSIFTGIGKSSSFKAVVNELLWVDVTVCNPLQVALSLANVGLIYKFTKEDESEAEINVPPIKEFIIPEDSTNVLTFEINPQSVGDLQLVGISYQLSIAKLTGFTSQTSISTLDLTGQQLFRSGANTSIRVCPSAPKLDVIYENFPHKMLCGELKSNKVCLANIGQCNMKNVKVAYGSHTKCLFTPPDKTLLDAQAHFLRVTGQSYEGEVCQVQTLVHRELKPNESVELLCWIHAPSSDNIHPLNLYFYYESAGNIDGQLKSRTLKYSNDVFTRPSLSVQPLVNWDNSRQGALISVNMTNISQSCAFNGAKLLCSSKDWVLGAISQTPSPEIDVFQSAKVYFEANNIHENLEGNLQKLDLLEKIGMTSSAFSVEGNNLSFKSVSDFGNILSPENPGYLLVALEWQARCQGETLVGQHYLHLSELVDSKVSLSKIGLLKNSNAAEDSSQSLVALHQLVKWKLEFERSKQHDFITSGACFVKVKIVLQNQYDCELNVDVNGMDSNQTQTTGIPAASTRFLWAGKCLSKFTMQPKKTHTVTMKACISSAGVYNLNSFSVWAVPTRIMNKIPLLPQNCHYSCLVTINDANYKP